jgi:hypothetical protein
MPNPPKPNEIKKKIGSKNYKAPVTDVVLPMSEDVPQPLRPLELSGAALWDRVWNGAQLWLSNRTDIELVQLVCEQLDERDLLRAFVLENMEAWHERAALRQLEKDIASNLGQLGFSPAERTRLGLAEVKRQSKLEELMSKKNG